MRNLNPQPLAAVREAARSKTPLGRPRDESIDAEVVAAVLQLLRKRGYGAVTIASVARKVKTARTSLYRRWPSKRHLVAYAVVSEMGAKPAADTGELRADLEAAVQTLLRAFAGPLGQALPGLVADMAQDPELAAIIREEVLAARRKSMREAFERAEVRGEIRKGFETELLLDMLTGPFYYRALFGHAPITARMARDVVTYIGRIVARGVRRVPAHARVPGDVETYRRD
ncbi:MAG: TetR/AcrR family transcriptional regulator [Proteobacteria bacterium]|nr:TetR/AcrR family transcriptional regulator [Pseudomonadota bacterium]